MASKINFLLQKTDAKKDAKGQQLTISRHKFEFSETWLHFIYKCVINVKMTFFKYLSHFHFSHFKPF